MRQVEIQRMEFLRNKAKTPEGLTDKELERLRGLEAKEFSEQAKGGKEDGGKQPSAGSNTRATTGGVDSQDGGKVGREGSGDERANGDEPNLVTSRPSGPNDGSSRKNGVSGRSSRTKSVESGGDSGRSLDDSRGDSGDDGNDGTESGRVGGSIGDGGQEEIKIVGSSHLKPKTSVVPKRKKAKDNKKKSNELDADMISALLTSGFGLIAKATARPHWEITEDEADSVAEPMEFLIDNMTAKQKKAIEKYSNPIMLASAVAGIVVPRIMIDLALIKHNKPKGVTQHVRTERTIEATLDGGSQSDFKLGGVSKDGGNSDAGQVASPVNDSVITGLFKSGD